MIRFICPLIDPVHLYNHVLEEIEGFGSDAMRKDQANRVLQHMSANSVLPDAYTLASYIRAAKDSFKPQDVVLVCRCLNSTLNGPIAT